MAAFVVPEAGEPFEFTLPGRRKVHRVPRMLDLPYQRLRAIQERITSAEDADEAATEESVAVFEEYAPGSTEGLTARQLGALVRAWMDEGGDEVGEAGSSSE